MTLTPSNEALWTAIYERLSEWNENLKSPADVLAEVEMNTDDVTFCEVYESWDGEDLAADIRELAELLDDFARSKQICTKEHLAELTEKACRYDQLLKLGESHEYN
jgi:hypothetical protein